ncbi:GGDEF domain-containing protein [Oricola cellulosilytica]|uniref:diguanylate cyclase n=1 Tax=Oricola cellulosilytica TaxID=1429082 RepID=A0A4R0PH44_9HYPH|nr:GGDEF domain-containing protein [Oricola cellulosilytica]TCD15920.1 GGDEF domain-containing protein [Oricola cellulosilytica]
MSGQSFFQLVGPLIFLVFAFGFAILWRSFSELRSAGFFAASFLFRAFGFLADFSRPVLQPNLAILATLGFYSMAGVAFCVGVFRLYSVPFPGKRFAAFMIAAGSAVLWFRFADDNLALRIALVHGTAAVILLYLPIALHRRMTRPVDRFLQFLLAANGTQFIVRTAVTLSLEGGGLTLSSLPDSLTATAFRLAISVSTVVLAATLFAIYAIEVVNRLTTHGETDPLTRLLNRRGFDARTDEISRRLKTGGPGHWMLIADIDGFKSINDTHGHDVGDRIITHFARILAGTARERDVVVRWGGDEFVVIIANSDLRTARLFAEAVRLVFEQAEHSGMAGHRVTASFGIAQWQEGEAVRDVYKRADAALYEAKSHGRNCARTAPFNITPTPMKEVGT